MCFIFRIDNIEKELFNFQNIKIFRYFILGIKSFIINFCFKNIMPNYIQYHEVMFYF